MPRRPRVSAGGVPFHVLNRAVGRGKLFFKPADYEAFVHVIDDLQQRLPTRLLSYCLMPNHWHLVLWPTEDRELSEFMRLLTVTHTQRWHAHHRTAGTGPLYQGRFKSFPIEADDHLLTVCRYVERNALRAKLVERAEDWQWGSLAARKADRPAWLLPLSAWPAEPPRQWARFVNAPQTAAEEAALLLSEHRGRPFGNEAWQRSIAGKLELESTFRPRGRPKKERPT